MQAAPATPLALDTLSQHLLEHQERALWCKVFLACDGCPVEFLQGDLYLVCTDAPRHCWEAFDLSRFAERFDGWHEPLGGDDALMAFRDAAGALRAALVLQQLGADTGLRVAITTAKCSVACIGDSDGAMRRIVMPPEACQPEAALRRVPASAVLICADSYAALEPLLAHEAGDVLVTTEYDPGDLAEACITLLPQATSGMSTFAGLGRC
jgi:hypothetical protein